MLVEKPSTNPCQLRMEISVSDNVRFLFSDYNCAREDEMRGSERYECPIIVYDRYTLNFFRI